MRFEVSMYGGAMERRWRRQRADLLRLPWDTIDVTQLTGEERAAARRFWTAAAFQEHKTAAACAATVEALIAAQAPIDLVAHASGFLTDEMAHVELCARVAALVGGGATIEYTPADLVPSPTAIDALERAAELVLRVFCVGEAFSVPMQRATAQAEARPLLAAVWRRIAKDEAAHGRFGWLFFDWADGLLDDRSRARLQRIASAAIAEIETSLPPAEDAQVTPFGWLPPDAYRLAARRALENDVKAPLEARGLLR